ncbi:MAG: DUF4876 domain-containing protein [Candidatus Krumholzibacteriaceae bacterium]|jgi:hypothetical protein
MTQAVLYIMVSGVCAAAVSCGLERPMAPDGRGELTLTVADTSGLLPGSVEGVPFYLDSTEVRIESQTQIFTASRMTNPAGMASFDHLDAGRYSVFARREIYLGSAKKTFTGSFSLLVQGKESVRDTVFVKPVSSSQLMINELYYCGSCASSFYFYDQYVELYNASADTMYLDGDIVTRELGVIDPEMEQEDYVRAIYAYQFPGTPLTGHEYPIRPKQFMVLASDAVNHKLYCANAVDLSNADWEFFNALGNDYDNLNVPNLNSITDRTTDYLIALTHNAVVIATGDEYTIDANDYVRIPVRNVIDGVEYNSNPVYVKEMTVRIDAGFAGIGIVKYSGYSTERRELGLDTNDSTFDFMNLVHPTPGFFHGH